MLGTTTGDIAACFLACPRLKRVGPPTTVVVVVVAEPAWEAAPDSDVRRNDEVGESDWIDLW
jgi:hypothetical protein